MDAGRRLAAHLKRVLPADVVRDAVVLGLPRGGVPVAFEVAKALDAPLDVIVVRKVGVPDQRELAMGSIAEGNLRFVNEKVVRYCQVTRAEYEEAERREKAVLEARSAAFREGHPRVPLRGRTAIIVDDGIATGSTARVACLCVRQVFGASRVILATPVAPPDSVEQLRDVCDEIIALATPHPFNAIGIFYVHFDQTTDEEVIELLSAKRDVRETVDIEAERVSLEGELCIPSDAKAVVLFVHGSGSSRHSPRNQFVASVCNNHQLGTVLFDLLTRDEEMDRRNVFDIAMLARRLHDVHRWVRARYALPIMYFGASTGGGAALVAAAKWPDVAAVVSRGGRPDLAHEHLAQVRAPTLLIVGGDDHEVIALNRSAKQHLKCDSKLEIVPGASHLFEEPGTLEQVANLAVQWFLDHAQTQ